MLYPLNPPFREVWIEFPYGSYPMVARHYLVSNYGFIHNLKTGNIIPLNKNYDLNHHITVRLSTIDGEAYSDELHRIVLSAFCPIPYQQSFDVNHKDGVKYHNWLWNLEWCTKSYNVQHAIQNNLISLGEDRNNTVATNEQIEEICELLSKGYTTKEICSMVYIPNCDLRRLIQNIKNGHCWKHISSRYDLSNMYKVSYTLNEDQIRVICSALEIDNKLSAHELLQLVGINYNSMDKNTKSRYASFISSIRHKKIFIDICNEYSY